MVDFSKMMKLAQASVPTDPIEIYKNLDLTATVGELRPVQEEVLTKWYSDLFEKKDIILKLHTGEGKTLIGMLMLLSRLNKGLGPCIYVSPNKQLAEQASLDAKKFGIQHILLSEGEIPSEFLESKKILITHVHKVFNGLTKFGLDNKAVKVGTFVLDDSHACIDSIRSAFTIQIKRNEPLFDILLRLFETELRLQGEGSYYDICSNPYSSDLLAVPYWIWNEKCDTVLRHLMEYEEESYIHFTLPLVKDKLRYCTMYASGRYIEIVPYYPLVERFTSFTQAKQRILMSATTQDNSFFVRGLGLSPEAVEHPLTSKTKLWSGEKMIVFPSTIDDRLTNEVIRKYICQGSLGKKKTTVLVPSYRVADEYSKSGCNVPANEDEIKSTLINMKAGKMEVPTIFTNRYDGIDLADDMCRILILDTMPVFNSLSDLYEEQCRTTSDMINIKIAQKIEQGLGRSVRGERDYTTILITGANLVRFMKSSATRKYFSAQTNMQITIGEEVAKQSSSEIDEERPLKPIHDLMLECLKRKDGWKQYYKMMMDTLTPTEQSHPLLGLLTKEREADLALVRKDWEKVIKIYRDIVNSLEEDPQEKGWYMQELAKYMSLTSITDSKKAQQSAYSYNQYVLSPDTVIYKRVSLQDDNRLKNIKTFISQYADYTELKMTFDEMMANLSWGVSSKKFEVAMQKIGLMLGFASQRPDNEIKKGPDNLWAMPGHEYMAIECKNEVDIHRDSISKTEAGQMEMHCGWFEDEYGEDTGVTYLWVHPTNKLAEDVNLSHTIYVMTPEQLDLFKKHLTAFIGEFSKFNIQTVTEESIHEFLVNNKLSVKDIKTYYRTNLTC